MRVFKRENTEVRSAGNNPKESNFKTSSSNLESASTSNEDVQERKLSSLWLEQVDEEADGSSETFVQAVRRVRCSRRVEFRRLHELGETEGAVEMAVVPGQAVEEQKDVTASGDPVADARTFLQQTSLPSQLAALETGVQEMLVVVYEIRLGEQVNNAWITNEN